MIFHTLACLFYFSCRKEGDIPLGVVNIQANCDPTYEEVNNCRPSLPLPSALEVVGGVNLESCPAYVSATEVVDGVNLESCPAYMSATEGVDGVNLESCPAYMSATEGVDGVNLELEYVDTGICRPPNPPTSTTEEVGDYLEMCPASISATEEVGAT